MVLVEVIVPSAGRCIGGASVRGAVAGKLVTEVVITAESVAEIHPIERAALVLTRIVDIWPFAFGNLTIAMMFGNMELRHAGLAPFFVLTKHKKEFNTVIAQAMAIETQPLVNAIYNNIKREMEALARR